MKNISIILLFILAHTGLFAQNYKFDDIPDSLKNNSDAVFRSHQMVFRVLEPGKAIETVKVAVTLLNKNAGIYRFVAIDYNDYSKINFLRGAVYDEAGDLIKTLGSSDINDMSAVSGGTFYSDERVKFMNFPLNRYPFTIEYVYEKEYSSLISYPVWSFQESPEISVERSGLQLILPGTMEMRYFEHNVKNKVDFAVSEGLNIYTWQEENMPAYNVQDAEIQSRYDLPYVYTGPVEFEYGGYKGSMKTWKDLGLWVYEINKNQGSLSDEEVSAVVKLAGSTTDKKEKIRLVYEYMQSKTRYLSMQIGIGGFKSAEAGAVSKNGFGDCKALVNYTQALLKAVGIDSYYALVKAGSFRDIIPDIVFPQFDHVILCAPVQTDTIWLECTSQSIPFNYLGRTLYGKNALLINPEGGTMIRTPGDKRGLNVSKRSGVFYMNVLGSATARINAKYNGSFFGSAHSFYYMQSEDEMRRILFSNLRYSDFKVPMVSYSESALNIPESSLDYQLEIKNFASINGSRVYFNPSFSMQNYLPDSPVSLSIGASSISLDSLTYNLPSGFVAEFVPAPRSLTSKYGIYSYKVSAEGSKVVFVRKLELFKSDIPVKDYEEIKNFINDIARTDRQKVILFRLVKA